MTLVDFGSEPRPRTGPGTGAKALLRHSPSFFLYTIHTYSRHRGVTPRPLLGHSPRERVPLHPSSRISRHSFALPCPLGSPSPPSHVQEAPFGTAHLPQKKKYRGRPFTTSESPVGTVFMPKEKCCTLVFVSRRPPSATPKIHGNYRIKFVPPPIFIRLS